MKKYIRNMSYRKRLTRLIRVSALSLNNWDRKKWGNLDFLTGDGREFWDRIFQGRFREGEHT
jgi:hypothetical protein